jgi:hypothetical protein
LVLKRHFSASLHGKGFDLPCRCHMPLLAI